MQIIVEDEDGEVVKTYELPSGKGEQAEAGASGSEEKTPAKPSWATFGGRFGVAGGEQARKKSIAETQAADDKHIRFTIGGVGKRMTKEDFIREMQKLDSRTRKEVVDQSTASQTVKRIATQEVAADSVQAEHSPTRGEQPQGGESSSPPRRGRRPSTAKPSEEQGETAVERKRRLAVLATQEDEEAGETPAERRRREAALGVGHGEDSDDEGGERVPPERKGITFAASTRPGKSAK